MATRSATSTLLIVCLLVFTFPLWIAMAGGLIGLVAGIFGATIGIIAGAVGLMAGIIAFPFKLLLGWGHGGWFPHFHFHGFLFLAGIILLIALLLKKKQ
jgi:hypothetical protein